MPCSGSTPCPPAKPKPPGAGKLGLPSNTLAAAPQKPGVHVYDDWDLADLRNYIDWTPFFRAWELHGNFPAILTDEIVGESATSLFADANAMLDKIINEKEEESYI